MKPAVIFICAALCAAACSPAPAPAPAAPLKVLSFNLLRFDDAKAAAPKTAAFMASLLRDADVAALQEGLQVSAVAVRAFAEMAGPNRGFLLGPPQGRNGFYRENFVFIYNTDRVTPAASALYPDADKIFERPPMAAHFKTASSGFIVLNCHIKPDETGGQTAREIAALPEAARCFAALWRENNVLVAGDLNADGACYDETGLALVFPRPAWTIITGNGCDTTVSPRNSFTYDRLIASKSMSGYWTGAWGVLRFDTWDECRDVTPNPMSDISDHYPLWAGFSF